MNPTLLDSETFSVIMDGLDRLDTKVLETVTLNAVVMKLVTGNDGYSEIYNKGMGILLTRENKND